MNTRVLAWLLGGVLALLMGYLIGLYVERGCPRTGQWRLALFISGWASGTFILWGFMVPRGLPEFILSCVLGLGMGYLAMTRFVTRVRVTYAYAEKRRRKEEEEDRLEDERRGLR